MFCLFFVGRTSKGAGQLQLRVFHDLLTGAAPPFFISAGAITNYQPNVMRRRLQGIKHTDCTARWIFGRRNRYALAAPMVTGTPAATKSVYNNLKFYRDGSFLFSSVGIVPTTIVMRTALTLGDLPIEISTVGREFVRFYFTIT